jgi:hypothetical protein
MTWIRQPATQNNRACLSLHTIFQVTLLFQF